MVITVNGRQETLESSCSLTAYLTARGVDPKTVVIERNGDIPDRATWGDIQLSDGDSIEILKFMGGG